MSENQEIPDKIRYKDRNDPTKKPQICYTAKTVRILNTLYVHVPFKLRRQQNIKEKDELKIWASKISK